MIYYYLKTSHLSLSHIQTIRRYLLTEIYTLGICCVDILLNNTVISDDLLSQRLFLIPIIYKTDKLIPKSSCNCNDYCDKCSYTLEININKIGYINSIDLNIDNDYIIPNDLLLFYNKGQTIIKCKIIKASGIYHSIWNHLTIKIIDNDINIYSYSYEYIKLLLEKNNDFWALYNK